MAKAIYSKMFYYYYSVAFKLGIVIPWVYQALRCWHSWPVSVYAFKFSYTKEKTLNKVIKVRLPKHNGKIKLTYSHSLLGNHHLFKNSSAQIWNSSTRTGIVLSQHILAKASCDSLNVLSKCVLKCA